MSTLRASLESIVNCLSTEPLDSAAVERCAPGLSELGRAVTAHLEAEFDTLIDAAEENAA